MASSGFDDDDDDGVLAGAFHLLAHVGHDLGVGGEQVVAAHAGLAGDAGGDDDDVAADGVFVVGGADDVGIEAHDGRSLAKVEAFAFGHVAGLGDIEEDDVSELGGGAPVGGGGADIAGADDGDFGTTHEELRECSI